MESEHYTKNSLNTKSSVGKRIFKESLEKQALKIITESKNIAEGTRIEAKNLLNKENRKEC